ncbi:ribosomal protein L17 [Mesotoga prima MesG1.Ag.4.2]|uniref:Large ribosomal subunit protein bL17 n=1 Tax=Mesotoga prima MesG1.Ag.4.2 TaxID=660470 RepID=I2F3C0_9BACT|nr:MULTISPECIES: 50S ribosomal protein L17 [Mesotoga]MDK2943520.1 large subunit ribosomal protein [Mesotoga sp.]AFK06423.1 ribosomal protein L17 [Mesotoga prima MesG1.Ag.4.2]PIJ62223.1 50S ribosomal protein L17 [Mesotoga sp. H07.pep.5.3]HNQ69967.1 50S ribosomal protein L17 [Mesotoga prima]HNS74992.1 50S ribosomal protein L17 [Mesotoga prima]
MRHRVSGSKLNMPHSQRVALMRNLARELFEHGTIVTTVTRAKELRPFVESIITKAKKASLLSVEISSKGPDSTETQALKSRNLALHREINRNFNDRKLVKKICDEVAVKYHERNGGYTRIVKLGMRRGDASEMAVLQLIDNEEKQEKKPEKKAEKKQDKK